MVKDEQPNLFELEGGNVKVHYSTTGTDGKPHFTFERAGSQNDLSGGFRALDARIGTLVTAPLDKHGTEFTLIIPTFWKDGLNPDPAPFTTYGIITHDDLFHTAKGVKQTYELITLKGTAQWVRF